MYTNGVYEQHTKAVMWLVGSSTCFWLHWTLCFSLYKIISASFFTQFGLHSQEWQLPWADAACRAVSWACPTVTAGCGRREKRAASSSPRSGSGSGSSWRGRLCIGTPASRWDCHSVFNDHDSTCALPNNRYLGFFAGWEGRGVCQYIQLHHRECWRTQEKIVRIFVVHLYKSVIKIMKKKLGWCYHQAASCLSLLWFSSCCLFCNSCPGWFFSHQCV